MGDPFRAESLFIGHALEAKKKAALKKPDTSIHTVTISPCSYDGGDAKSLPDVPLVLNFLQNNQNIKCVKIHAHCSSSESNGILLQLVAAAAKNPKTDSPRISINLKLRTEADVRSLCKVLTLYTTKIAGLTLELLQKNFLTSSTGAVDLASAIMGLRVLRTLNLSWLPGSFCFHILNAMSAGKFSFLESVELSGPWTVIGTNSREKGRHLDRTMMSLASFLKSEGSSSLKKLRLNIGAIDSDEAEKLMEHLSFKTHDKLEIHVGFGAHTFEANPALTASLAKIPSIKEWTLDMFARMKDQVRDQLLQALTSSSNSKLSKLSYHICDDDRAHFGDTSNFLKELLVKTPSLRCLEITDNFQRDTQASNAWVQTVSEGLACNKTLTSLCLDLDWSSGLSASSIDPFFAAIASPNTRLEILHFYLWSTTQLCSNSLKNMLHNPCCKLKVLEVCGTIEDEHVLMLLSASKGCKTLQSLSLEHYDGWTLETWLAIASNIPYLALTSLSLYDDQLSPEGDEGARLKEALLKGLELNGQLLSVCFNQHFKADTAKVCLRNKARKAGEFLSMGKLPIAIAPKILQKVQKDCQYGPGMANHRALKAEVLYRLLRSKPCTEVMDAANDYLTGDRPLSDRPKKRFKRDTSS